MAKTMEELLGQLDPTAGPAESVQTTRSVVDPRAFLAMIEMMREHPCYSFADDTLRGIYDSVEKANHVTEGQRKAVVKIRHSVRNWEDAEVDDV